MNAHCGAVHTLYSTIPRLNDRKEELKAEHAAYVESHPELKNILADFMTRVLLEKPDDVKEFAAEHFMAFLKPEDGEGAGEGGGGDAAEGKGDESGGGDGEAKDDGAEGDDGAAGDAGTASASGGGGGATPAAGQEDQGGAAAASVAPLVVCGPSGVGKGTLIGRLLEEFGKARFGFSVSHTTRAPRAGEEHGVHYNFTDVASMRAEIAEGKFIEFAEVHKNLYGTSKRAVSSVAEEGRVCILDIDTQGVIKVKAAQLAPRPLYLFIAPPSFEVLEARLRGRGTEDEAAIVTRTANARKEMDYGAGEGNFDHTIVNDDLETAYAELKAWVCEQYPHLTKA